MCLAPEVIALMASTAAAVQSHNNQQDAANKQGEAIKQSRDMARMDAERAQQQAAEASAAEANAHSMQAMKDMAAFDAIAAEAGSSGATAQRGSVALGVQNGQNMATIASNSRRTQTEIAMGDLASANKAAQAMASIQRPSTTMTALTIAGHGVDYMKARSRAMSGTGASKAS